LNTTTATSINSSQPLAPNNGSVIGVLCTRLCTRIAQCVTCFRGGGNPAHLSTPPGAGAGPGADAHLAFPAALADDNPVTISTPPPSATPFSTGSPPAPPVTDSLHRHIAVFVNTSLQAGSLLRLLQSGSGHLVPNEWTQLFDSIQRWCATHHNLSNEDKTNLRTTLEPILKPYCDQILSVMSACFIFMGLQGRVAPQALAFAEILKGCGPFFEVLYTLFPTQEHGRFIQAQWPDILLSPAPAATPASEPQATRAVAPSSPANGDTFFRLDLDDPQSLYTPNIEHHAKIMATLTALGSNQDASQEAQYAAFIHTLSQSKKALHDAVKQNLLRDYFSSCGPMLWYNPASTLHTNLKILIDSTSGKNIKTVLSQAYTQEGLRVRLPNDLLTSALHRVIQSNPFSPSDIPKPLVAYVASYCHETHQATFLKALAAQANSTSNKFQEVKGKQQQAIDYLLEFLTHIPVTRLNSILYTCDPPVHNAVLEAHPMKYLQVYHDRALPRQLDTIANGLSRAVNSSTDSGNQNPNFVTGILNALTSNSNASRQPTASTAAQKARSPKPIVTAVYELLGPENRSELTQFLNTLSHPSGSTQYTVSPSIQAVIDHYSKTCECNRDYYNRNLDVTHHGYIVIKSTETVMPPLV